MLYTDEKYGYMNKMIKPTSNEITISGVGNTPVGMFLELDSAGNKVDYWDIRNRTITLKENTTQIRISVLKEVVDILKIEDGVTATEYETGGYKIPVKASGKNLCDISVGKWSKNYIYADGRVVHYDMCALSEYYIPASPNTSYTISVNTTPYTLIITEYDVEKGIIGYNRARSPIDNKLTITTKENTRFIRWCLDYEHTYDTLTQEMIENLELQLEQNSTVTDYKPYIEPIITNIYLLQLW
jgi:hypothetical protein